MWISWVFETECNEKFDEILELIAPVIRKADAVARDNIPPREMLLITLRYLASTNYLHCKLLFYYSFMTKIATRWISSKCSINFFENPIPLCCRLANKDPVTIIMSLIIILLS